MEENKQEENENEYDEVYDDYGFSFNESNNGYSENGLPIMDLDFSF